MTDIPFILTGNLRSLPFWERLYVAGPLFYDVSRFEMWQEKCSSVPLRHWNFWLKSRESITHWHGATSRNNGKSSCTAAQA